MEEGLLSEKNQVTKIKKEEKEVKEQIKLEEENHKSNTESLNFQITSTFNFENSKILKIKELSNKKIGILLNDSLSIYYINNFKKSEEIELPIVNGYSNDERIFDFIELKNSDLVLWAPDKILLYKISENKYQLYQTIKDLEEPKTIKDLDEDFYYGSNKKKYQINSVYELSNGNLVCCNSFGLTIYKRNNDIYELDSKHEMELDVRKIIEINPNQLILFQRYHYFYWMCSRNNFSSHTYAISIYDIETKTLNKLASNKVTKNDYYGYTLFSFLVKKGFLLVRYGNRIDIYDIKNNMNLINHDQEDMVKIEEKFYGNFKILKDDMNIIFLCDYSDDLFIAKNAGDTARIYKFEDNSVKYVKEFPFQLEDLEEIIKLKNNVLLMYSKNKLMFLNNK